MHWKYNHVESWQNHLVAGIRALNEGSKAVFHSVLQVVLVYEGDEEAVQGAIGVERALRGGYSLVRQQHAHGFLDGWQRCQPLLCRDM